MIPGKRVNPVCDGHENRGVLGTNLNTSAACLDLLKNAFWLNYAEFDTTTRTCQGCLLGAGRQDYSPWQGTISFRKHYTPTKKQNTGAVHFAASGLYKVCYESTAGAPSAIAGEAVVLGAPPTVWEYNNSIDGTSPVVLFTGGSGLDLSTGADAAKVVPNSN